MGVLKSAQRRISSPIINSSSPRVSVIIPVKNERETIAQAIRNARDVHQETEVIVVVNGSKDGTEQVARQSGAKVISCRSPLGHDVGRSIGAMHAVGEILLFTDGDIVIPATGLKPFVHAVEHGVDVALNQYTGPTQTKNVHNVVLAKHAINALLHRSDLGGASLTAIPHALSRHALTTIGAGELSVPPKALALAIIKGLNVQSVHYVEVGKSNRRRARNKGVLESLIVGDHLEALACAMAVLGCRLGHTDLNRKRELVNGDES